MKHGKNPTVSEKRIMQSEGLIVDNWLVVKHTPKHLVVVHRLSNGLRTIPLTAEEEAEEDEDL